MPISIIVGGQFGSEGKGKVAYQFVKEKNARVAVRVGGPNSGHTIYDRNGIARIFKMLPTASILENVDCVLTSGSYIDLDILSSEIRSSGIAPHRLKIDPNAVVITEKIKEKEKMSGRRHAIGSTNSGTGAAVMTRISRNSQIHFAKDEPELRDFITPTKDYLRNALNKGDDVIIEGTQGYGLSVLHSEHYPYTTSRDTTAAGFLSEVGLSPLDVQNIIMVIRAFPIRVAGNSGPLLNEIDWNTVTNESGSKNELIEYTSVTKCIRRVARFDSQIVRKAIIANNPNIIVLNHLDYLDSSIQSKLSHRANEFLKKVEYSIERKVNYIGLNPKEYIPR